MQQRMPILHLDYGKYLAGNIKQEFKLEQNILETSGFFSFLASSVKKWIEVTENKKIKVSYVKILPDGGVESGPQREELMKIWESNNQLFICGNGGSAANAIHIANDLHYGLAQSVKSQKYGMKSDALPANAAIITCLANDTGYENIFSKYLGINNFI